MLRRPSIVSLKHLVFRLSIHSSSKKYFEITLLSLLVLPVAYQYEYISELMNERGACVVNDADTRSADELT